MGDRHSDQSYKGKVEEATYGIKTNPTSAKQLSSSGDVAQSRRAQKPMDALGEAAQALVNKGGSGPDKSKSEAKP